MKDDVPEETKKARLQEVINTFNSIASTRNKRFIGTHQLVLVDKVGITVKLWLPKTNSVHRLAGNQRLV